MNKLNVIGKILGIITATIGVWQESVPLILFGAFMYFANSKIGE